MGYGAQGPSGHRDRLKVPLSLARTPSFAFVLDLFVIEKLRTLHLEPQNVWVFGKPIPAFLQMLIFNIWSVYLKYSYFFYFLFSSSELLQFSVLHAFNSVVLQRQFSTVNVPAPHSIWSCFPENTLQVAQTCYFAWLVTHMLSCFAAQPPPSEANLGQPT